MKLKRALLISSFVFMTSHPLALAQDEPPRFEIFGGYSGTKNDGYVPSGSWSSPTHSVAGLLGSRALTNTHGWNASVAYYFTRRFGLVADFEGQYSPRAAYRQFTLPDLDWQYQIRSRSYSVQLGPRFSFRPDARIRPFAQGMVGVTRLNDRALGHGRATVSYHQWDSENGFQRIDETFDIQSLENRVKANSPTVSVGGGVDLRLSRHFAVRLFQCDVIAKRGRASGLTTYMLSGSNEAPVLTYRTNHMNQWNARFSYGLVVTF